MWQLEEALEGDGDGLPRVEVPEQGQYVVSTWAVAGPQTPYVLSIDGAADSQIRMSGLSGSGSGAVDVGPGQEVALEIRGEEADVRRAALVLYRRVG